MNKFISVFTFIAFCGICGIAHATIDLSGTLDNARRKLDRGEAFALQCTDPMHPNMCANAGFNNGEDKIIFYKNYNNNWGHVIHTCTTGHKCINNSCVRGTGIRHAQMSISYIAVTD